MYIFNNVNSREEAEKQKPDNAIVVSWYDPGEDKTIYGYVFESELPFTVDIISKLLSNYCPTQWGNN